MSLISYFKQPFAHPKCRNCLDAEWVCENHRDRPWNGMSNEPLACGCGAGAPCPVCNDMARPLKPIEKPRLAAVLTAPSRDEFAAWRDDPVTRFVMAALARNAEECRESWMRESWEGRNADQTRLVGWRERSDALLAMTADYDAFCEVLNLEPEVPNAA